MGNPPVPRHLRLRRSIVVAAMAGAMAVVAPARAANGAVSGDLALVEDQSPQAILNEAIARGSIRLDECFRMAVIVGERIGRSREAVVRTEASRREAWSEVLPQFTIEDTYFIQNPVELESSGSSRGSTFSTSDSRNEALLRLRQPIFHGFQERNFLRASADTIGAAREALINEERLLYGDVATRFYAVLLSVAAELTLEDLLKAERERLREVEARFDVGLARRTEVLLIRSQLDQDAARLETARSVHRIALERLSFLTGAAIPCPLEDEVAIDIPASDALAGAAAGAPTPPGAAVAPGDPGTIAEDPQFESVVAEALRNRPDHRRLERLVAVAGSELASVRGQALPSLDLDATYILDRWNYSEFATNTDWTATLGFSFPIFDSGRVRARSAIARSNLRDAELTRDESARAIRLELRERWLTLKSDELLLATHRSRVASADENFRLAQEEYRAGLATNLEVVTAQNQLLSARLDQDSQTYQVKFDTIALEVAQGLRPASSVGAIPPQ